MNHLRTMLLVAVSLLAAEAGTLYAIPRFSLLTGTRCSACHFNPQGGEIRTELGWSAMNKTGAFSLFGSKGKESTGGAAGGEDDFSSLAESGPAVTDSLGGEESENIQETNGYLNGLLTVGLDVRLQLAKLGRPTAEVPDVPRRFIPMQISPYIGVSPMEMLSLYGNFNMAGYIYRKMRKGNSTYPGQADWDGALLFQPAITAPSLKVGVIQPSIGIRHDDHTMFIRRDAAGSGSPLIPPYYNELGAELTYEGMNWLTVNAGVYQAKMLNEVDPTIDAGKPSYLGRVMLWPQLLDAGMNGQVGASYFANGDFRMVNVFAGIGLADRATIYGEGLFSRNATGKEVQNLSVLGSYQLAGWMSLDWRYEHGLTERVGIGPSFANAFVLGVEFFPIPFLEVRPEYRYLETDDYELGQYTIQVHAFY
jgi:hypothetical protein